VGVDLGGSHVFVTEQFLDGADISSRLKQMCRKTVAKSMATAWFGDAGALDRGFNRVLESGLGKVMAARGSGTWIERAFAGWKDVLPAPFGSRSGVFGLECEREINPAKPFLEILIVYGFHRGQVPMKWFLEASG